MATQLTRPTGSFVALVTPFNASGPVDYIALEELIAFQARHGTNALFLLGTAGEHASLTDTEWHEFVEKTAKFDRRNLAFYYGCAGPNTKATCDRLAFAKQAGADGAMLAVPASVGPSTDEAVNFFLACADHVDLPLGIHNNPGRLMTDLDAGNLRRVFAHPNVVVYKEGTNRTGQAGHLMRECANLSIMADDTVEPDIITPVMALGGNGICNAFGNIAPAEAAVLSTPWSTEGQPRVYRDHFLRLLPLLEFVYSARSPVATKALMRSIGLPAGMPRAPLSSIDEAEVLRGLRILQDIGFFTSYGIESTGRFAR
jgi:4-hydroxy-tetrahydrodipicolinate synthase